MRGSWLWNRSVPSSFIHTTRKKICQILQIDFIQGNQQFAKWQLQNSCLLSNCWMHIELIRKIYFFEIHCMDDILAVVSEIAPNIQFCKRSSLQLFHEARDENIFPSKFSPTSVNERCQGHLIRQKSTMSKISFFQFHKYDVKMIFRQNIKLSFKIKLNSFSLRGC